MAKEIGPKEAAQRAMRLANIAARQASTPKPTKAKKAKKGS